MSDLSSLTRPSISTMPYDEALATVMRARNARMQPTKRSSKRAAVAAKTPGKKAEALLNNINPQQAQAILQALKERSK